MSPFNEVKKKKKLERQALASHLFLDVSDDSAVIRELTQASESQPPGDPHSHLEGPRQSLLPGARGGAAPLPGDGSLMLAVSATVIAHFSRKD